MPKFVVYTDGGARNNGKSDAVGAWAFIVYDYQGKRIGSKSAWKIGCTNNQMEMSAVYGALVWANKHGYQIEIYIDSNFVKQGCESWLWSWAKKDWRKSDGEVVLNKELWQQIHKELSAYMDKHREIPTFVKVSAHTGIEGNEAADLLCNVRMTEAEMEMM